MNVNQWSWWQVVLAAILLIGLLMSMESVPPPWWDEGWTLSVARNWIELGHYGRLLDGEIAPRGLESGLPVTASVALSFALFGVGIHQARLVAITFTLAALFALFLLADRFYNRLIAIGTLAVLVFLYGHIEINPLIAGRQVMGEIPSLCFLLTGYLAFLAADRRPFVATALAVVLWSLALFTKAQVQPFWATSMALTLGLMVFRKRWRAAGLIATGFVGSISLFLCYQYYFAAAIPSSTITGLARAIALAVSKHSRLAVLYEILQFGLPTLFGLSWAVWSFLKSGCETKSHVDVVRFSFFVLTLCWFGWYGLLSLGWPRYFLPPAFLGSIFVAAMLHDWTDKFSWAATVERAASMFRSFRIEKTSVAAITALVLVAMSAGRTMTILYEAYVLDADDSLKETVEFLNTKTPRDSLIETYESELFAFLQRRYHYPPDQVHVHLIRKFSLGERVTIEYDPLARDPDYLVIGQQNRFWDFYDAHIKSGGFRLIQTLGRYKIFERVR